MKKKKSIITIIGVLSVLGGTPAIPGPLGYSGGQEEREASVCRERKERRYTLDGILLYPNGGPRYILNGLDRILALEPSLAKVLDGNYPSEVRVREKRNGGMNLSWKSNQRSWKLDNRLDVGPVDAVNVRNFLRETLDDIVYKHVPLMFVHNDDLREIEGIVNRANRVVGDHRYDDILNTLEYIRNGKAKPRSLSYKEFIQNAKPCGKYLLIPENPEIYRVTFKDGSQGHVVNDPLKGLRLAPGEIKGEYHSAEFLGGSRAYALNQFWVAYFAMKHPDVKVVFIKNPRWEDLGLDGYKADGILFEGKKKLAVLPADERIWEPGIQMEHPRGTNFEYGKIGGIYELFTTKNTKNENPAKNGWGDNGRRDQRVPPELRDRMDERRPYNKR